ncbi:MAG: lactate utilization protein [Candidatus Sungbacteria bacterium]|uniref:Lactate utilization protein n=1 Tax=Candidatus Sungiibacteriota bacterium TaxID=2750080 RepID=A0A9D6QYP0_9BACT|nr:lactate utilization protein [Candidatus Sungbacteria bacterium]
MSFDIVASKDTQENLVTTLKGRNVEVILAENGAAALDKIKSLIPQGASVMNGSSVTLETIGFVDYLKSGAHGWNNLHAAILAEKDPAKQSALRKQAVLSDYYLGSVHAIAETGEMIIGSNSGSQLPHVVFTSPNIIFVAGAQKIVPTFDTAMQRLKEYVIPLEDRHMQEKYGVGTYPSKIVIFNRENPMMGRTVWLMLVNEKLGF